MNRALAFGIVLVVGLVVLSSTLFTVHQTQQVLITQFGQPIRVITEPGLQVKAPFIQNVITFDRRLLDFDAPGEEIILSDQRRLIVDSFTRYRITNPLLFFQTAGATEAGIRGALSRIVSSTLRSTLGSEPLLSVLSNDRARVMDEIRRRVNEEATRFGIEVTDVRIRRADLPEENTQAILNRMQSERERVAREARAEGAEVAARVRAGADRERTVLLAEAQAQADTLRGRGEQDAIAIFADAFQRDPQFFQFWRTMQAYREAFGEGDTRLLLSPDSEFFRYFRGTMATPVPSGAQPAGQTGAQPAGQTGAQPAAPPVAQPAAQPAAAAPVTLPATLPAPVPVPGSPGRRRRGAGRRGPALCGGAGGDAARHRRPRGAAGGPAAPWRTDGGRARDRAGLAAGVARRITIRGGGGRPLPVWSGRRDFSHRHRVPILHRPGHRAHVASRFRGRLPTVRLVPIALAVVIALPLGLLPAAASAQTAVPQIPPPGAPPSFAPLARQLLPAVVNIQVSQGTGQARAGRDAPDVPQAPPGSPFEEFFRDFLERNRPGPRGEGQPSQPGPQAPRRAQSLGSGFIIDPSGIVVTNNHVIDGAEEITVVLQDDTRLRAELLGTDPRTDLAVLRVRHTGPLPAVAFGDSDTAEVGDWVVAIGNPFGLGGSVTAGIVSARGRDIRQGTYDDFIQTDAAINRGNSGGPLFNLAGEVVGINTAIYSPTGGSIGIGFSIPSNLAKNIVGQLREHGRVRRGWLGVNIQQVTDEIAESLTLRPGPRGALVASAREGGPAAAGGIQAGDVILRFNNTDVREMRFLPRIVADTPVGAQVPVVVWRNGREQTVTVTVAELPAEQQQAAVQPNQPAPRPQQMELSGLGLKISPITPESRERFSLRPESRGVVITEVSPNSPAAERELRVGDVIVEVQQERVNSPQEVQDRLERLRRQGRATALLLIESAQGQRWVPLRLNAPPSGRGG